MRDLPQILLPADRLVVKREPASIPARLTGERVYGEGAARVEADPPRRAAPGDG